MDSETKIRLVPVAADTTRPLYVVTASPFANTVVHCRIDYKVNIKDTNIPGYYNPTTGTYSPGFSFPSKYEELTQHDSRPVLRVRELVDRVDTLLCFVPAHVDPAGSYFCRNDRYEKLLDEPDWFIHPGYSILDPGFWVAVPKSRIVSMLVTKSSTQEVSESEPAEDPGYLQTTLASEASCSCESLEVRAQRFAQYPGREGAWIQRTYSMRYAPEKALCLASRREDDWALLHLEETIRAVNEDRYWEHEALRPHYAALMLIRASRGQVSQSAAAAGALMHLMYPGWSLPLDPVPPIGTATPILESFMDCRGVEVRQHWQNLLQTIAHAEVDSTDR